jgi:cobalamin biosynthesis Co2+ chelatase CbiK
MKDDKESSKNEYQKILEKIEQESKEKKNERTVNIMRGETHKNKSYQPFNLLSIAKKFIIDRRVKAFKYFRIQ